MLLPLHPCAFIHMAIHVPYSPALATWQSILGKLSFISYHTPPLCIALPGACNEIRNVCTYLVWGVLHLSAAEAKAGRSRARTENKSQGCQWNRRPRTLWCTLLDLLGCLSTLKQIRQDWDSVSSYGSSCQRLTPNWLFALPQWKNWSYGTLSEPFVPNLRPSVKFEQSSTLWVFLPSS